MQQPTTKRMVAHKESRHETCTLIIFFILLLYVALLVRGSISRLTSRYNLQSSSLAKRREKFRALQVISSRLTSRYKLNSFSLEKAL